MAARSFAEVRQDFAARIAALAGWKLADVPFDLFGVSNVPDNRSDNRAHLSFSVGVESSEPHPDSQRSRQRVGGEHVVSTVVVRFLSRILAKDKLTSVDVGLDAELSLINQVLTRTASWPLNFPAVVWQRSSRSSNPSGAWRLHEVRFSVLHLIDNA